MTALPSQIRAYRILSVFAILQSVAVLGLRFTNCVWSWWWLGLATALFLWPLVLAIHPGRSILRFLLPTIIAAAFFVPSAPIYGVLIRYSFKLLRDGPIQRGLWNAARDLRPQWLAANNLETLLRSNPRIILYSIDADYRAPLEVRKGYRQLGMDEIILSDDVFTTFEKFVQMDKETDLVIGRVRARIGQTVNRTADEIDRLNYGCTMGNPPQGDEWTVRNRSRSRNRCDTAPRIEWIGA